jgi:hypothetical protein
MDQEKNPTIEKLIEHEKLIAQLYETYSNKLKYFSEFWKGLVEEEYSHAAWIETLYEKKKAGLVDSLDRKFPMEAVDMSVVFINQKISEAKEKELSILSALENAVYIESAMLEHKFFEVFPEDNMEMKILLEALRLSTEDHLARIKKEWMKESGQINEEMENKMQ